MVTTSELFEDLGLIGYQQAWDYQEKVHASMVEAKSDKGNFAISPKILLCEHPHVYTLGKSGQESNMLVNPQFLNSIQATYVKTNRGGDITYHGPGQIVGYPILDLGRLGIGIKSYIFKLEEAVIATLADYNIVAERFDGATGVWIDKASKGMARKICAIGVRVSRLVSMHGFALNVDTDLRYFSYINPCGLQQFGVSSMAKELGAPINMHEVKEVLKKALLKVLFM